MSLFHIANLFESDRLTAIAGADAPLGAVVVASDVGGERTVHPVANNQASLLVPGNYGIVFKVSKLQYAVSSSIGNIPDDFGIRTTSIKSGDVVGEARHGAIAEYDPSLLHASLDPARGGTLPVAGAALAVHGALWCTTGTADAITSPVIGRVHSVVNGKVRVELV